jgi:hypothetical protein
VAVANAGIIGAPAIGYAAAPAIGYAAAPAISYAAPAAVATPAITSQQSNILRSYGNLGQVSTYSTTLDTPYSSVRKSDVRVSNDALAYPAAHAVAAPVAYAAPALASAPLAYAAPAVHAAPAVAAYAAPALRAAPLGVAYSAAPAVAHLSFSGLGVNYGW